GRTLASRRRRTYYVAGAGVAAAAVAGLVMGPALLPALTMGTISIIAVPGLTTAMGVFPVIGVLAARDYIQNDRVVARFAQARRIVTVRAKHLGDIELAVNPDGETSLVLLHDGGWTEFSGTSAIHATSVLLAG